MPFECRFECCCCRKKDSRKKACDRTRVGVRFSRASVFVNIFVWMCLFVLFLFHHHLLHHHQHKSGSTRVLRLHFLLVRLFICLHSNCPFPNKLRESKYVKKKQQQWMGYAVRKMFSAERDAMQNEYNESNEHIVFVDISTSSACAWVCDSWATNQDVEQ